MALAMNATVTTMSVKPCWRSSRMTCSIIGRLAMGSIGLGWLEVSGRSRVPSPPAMITAFTRPPLVSSTLLRPARPSDSARRAGPTYDAAAIQASAARRYRPPRRRSAPDPASPRCRGSTGRRGRRTSGRTCRPCPPTARRCARAPSAASSSTIPATSTSRPRVARPNHSGTAPWTMIEITAVPTQQPVGHRVEDLAQRRDLVPAAGHEAVDPVGGAEDGQEHGRARLLVVAEEQPDEDAAGTASRTRVISVGHGEHPVEARLRVGVGPRAPALVDSHEASLRLPGLRRPCRPGRAAGGVGGRAGVCQSGAVPRFEPFVGLRYDPAVVHLDQVIAPPYDVIEPAERTRLAARATPPTPSTSSCPRPTSGPASTATRWPPSCSPAGRPKGCSRADAAPAFYPYRMTTPEGRVVDRGHRGPRDRRGGRRRPPPRADPAQAEERPPRPAAATRPTSPPSGGSRSPTGVSTRLAPTGPPAIDALDDDGVRHQLWVLDDPAAVAAIRRGRRGGARWSSPTATTATRRRSTYRREQRGPLGDAPGRPRPDHGVRRGAVRGPAARSGPSTAPSAGSPDGTDLAGAFGRWFDVVRAGDRHRAGGERAGRVRVPGPGHGRRRLVAHAPARGRAEAAGSDLDSSLVAAGPRGAARAESTYQPHLARGPRVACTTGEAQAAVLLRPVTVAPDRRVGPRPAAHAAQDHLLQPEAAHRHGVPDASRT